jgi:hypothetical protein
MSLLEVSTMAEKASGKAHGRSRPQTQSKNQNRSGQPKQSPDAGRGGNGGGPRGAANGTAARKGQGRSDERPQPKGKAREAREQQGRAREEQEEEPSQQETPQQAEAGGGGVGDQIKQHPITAAALGAGLTLLAAQGLRMAIGAGRDQAGGEAPDAFGSGEDQYEEDQGGEEEDDARGASASSEEEEGDDDQGEEGDESSGGFTGRLGRLGSKVGSAFRGSGNAIRRGARSGFERGRQGAGEAWHSHPLFVCGAALTAGAVAGFLLPSTSQEDSLLGKTSDKVAGRFKKAGQDFFRQGRSIAGRALHEAVNATATEAEREGLTPDRLGKKFKRVFSNVRDAVAESIQED